MDRVSAVSERSKPKRQNPAIQVAVERLRVAPWLLVLAILVASAGHDRPAWAGARGSASPEAAIRRGYEALAMQDVGRFAGSLEPAARPDQVPASALSVAFQFSQFPADTLASLSFADMAYEETRSDGTWAEVRVRGLIHNVALGTDIPMDAIEVAHRLDGGWYMSLPELYMQTPSGQDYAARIQRLNAEGCH